MLRKKNHNTSRYENFTLQFKSRHDNLVWCTPLIPDLRSQRQEAPCGWSIKKDLVLKGKERKHYDTSNYILIIKLEKDDLS